jgi:hypothetical protein
MQGNLSVVTTKQALIQLLGTERMRGAAGSEVAAWQVNVTKGNLPNARALKSELERRVSIVRAQP